MPRGRPKSISQVTFVETITKFSNRIIDQEKIVTKTNKVWKDISLSLNNVYTPESLYALVTMNRNGILDEIKSSLNLQNSSVDSILNDEQSEESDSSEKEDLTYNAKNYQFDVSISASQFEEITESVYYDRSTRAAKNSKRKYLIFKSGVWQPFFNGLLWENTRLKCGYNYKNHNLALEGTSGSFNAYCRCGTKVICSLSRLSDDEAVSASFEIEIGTGKNCGPSYLRTAEREKIVKEIESVGSVDVYRAQMSEKTMRQGDAKPAHIRSSNVLHKAKSEILKSEYLHLDPIEALDIMKCTIHTNEIRDIGKNPFSVDYWTNEQIHLYKKIDSLYGATICVDSTGLKLKPIKRPYSNEKASIFLYVLSIHCDEGQTTIAQRIASRHKTKDLYVFLMDFHANCPPPKEFVCDESRALLNAAVLTYTRYSNIEEYADAIKDQEIQTRIRIDIAHHTNKYAKLLKGVNRKVRTLYLAAMGKLRITEDHQEAEKIIEAILILCNSQTDGQLSNNELTECAKRRSWLIKNVTGDEQSDEVNTEEADETPDDEPADNTAKNKWGQWANTIHERVKPFFSQEGQDANAYFLQNEDLTKKLLKDLELFPVWSSILNSKFNFGRHSGSSAPVESEFNKIKNNLLAKYKTVRVDKFVHEHIIYLNGKTRLINAALDEKVLNNSHDNAQDSADNDNGGHFTAKNISLNEIENWKGQGNPINKNAIKKTCIACANGDLPLGAHKCAQCDTPVHIFDTCSLQLEGSEEGYGQKRICIACANKPVNKKSTKRIAKYTGNRTDDIKDSLRWDKNRSFPVIKNGNNPSLAAVSLDKKSITLKNTCAFDSLLYLNVVAASDFDFLCDKMESKNTKFFHMVLDILKNGIRAHSYKLRAEVLAGIFDLQPSPIDGHFVIHCATAIGWLTQNLFKCWPSFYERSSCSNCTYNHFKGLTAIQIQDRQLKISNVENFITDFCSNENVTTCPQCFNESVKHDLIDIGDVVFFQIFNEMEENVSFKLNDFHKSLVNPLQKDQHLLLIGAVGFHGVSGFPRKTRCSDPQNASFEETLGHYTTFVYRRGNTGWMEVDDMQDKAIFRPQQYKIVPRLIMYVKEQK